MEVVFIHKNDITKIKYDKLNDNIVIYYTAKQFYIVLKNSIVDLGDRIQATKSERGGK